MIRSRLRFMPAVGDLVCSAVWSTPCNSANGCTRYISTRSVGCIARKRRVLPRASSRRRNAGTCGLTSPRRDWSAHQTYVHPQNLTTQIITPPHVAAMMATARSREIRCVAPSDPISQPPGRRLRRPLARSNHRLRRTSIAGRVSPLGWWSFGPGADAPGALPGVSLLISGWAIA